MQKPTSACALLCIRLDDWQMKGFSTTAPFSYLVKRAFQVGAKLIDDGWYGLDYNDDGAQALLRHWAAMNAKVSWARTGTAIISSLSTASSITRCKTPAQKRLETVGGGACQCALVVFYVSAHLAAGLGMRA